MENPKMKNTVENSNLNSSALISYKYNKKLKELTITFNYGASYVYENIPVKNFKEFRKRRSVGKGYNKLIKKNEFNKVTEKVQ
jgi:hypothetical protein